MAELLELVAPGRAGRPLSLAALGRPAPAHGAGPGARRRARGAAARRAVRRPRRPGSQGPARVASPAARRDPRDHGDRDARPGGGDGGGRPRSSSCSAAAIEQEGPPARALREPGQPVRDELRGAGQRAGRGARPARTTSRSPSARNGTTIAATVERVVHLGFEVRVHVVLEDGTPMTAQLTATRPTGCASRAAPTCSSAARRARVRRRRRQHGRGRGGCPGARAERHRSRAAGPRTALEDPARGGGALRRPACWYGWCAAGGEHRCPTPVLTPGLRLTRTGAPRARPGAPPGGPA